MVLESVTVGSMMLLRLTRKELYATALRSPSFIGVWNEAACREGGSRFIKSFLSAASTTICSNAVSGRQWIPLHTTSTAAVVWEVRVTNGSAVTWMSATAVKSSAVMAPIFRLEAVGAQSPSPRRDFHPSAPWSGSCRPPSRSAAPSSGCGPADAHTLAELVRGAL